MILGPIQTQWLAGLRANPEQQMKGELGIPSDQKYCCLGKGLVILKGGVCRNDISLGQLTSGGSLSALDGHYKDLGLKSPTGCCLYGLISINGNMFSSLADANDSGATWPEVADWIEANPEKIFTKAV